MIGVGDLIAGFELLPFVDVGGAVRHTTEGSRAMNHGFCLAFHAARNLEEYSKREDVLITVCDDPWFLADLDSLGTLQPLGRSVPVFLLHRGYSQ